MFVDEVFLMQTDGQIEVINTFQFCWKMLKVFLLIYLSKICLETTEWSSHFFHICYISPSSMRLLGKSTLVIRFIRD